MQINGGCARIPDILRVPVNILASGPAAAPAAAMHLAGSVGEDLITVDMGGTSIDVCMIQGGRAAMSRDIQVEEPADRRLRRGRPLDRRRRRARSRGSTPAARCASVRAAPDRVPDRPATTSAAASRPSPTPTSCSATCDPDAFLGGRRRLRDDLSRAGRRRATWASRSGSRRSRRRPASCGSSTRTWSARSAPSRSSAASIRAASRSSAGAAPAGCTRPSSRASWGWSKVFVPLEAGVFCAFGMTVTDVRHDHLMALHEVSDAIDLDAVNELFAELEACGPPRAAGRGLRGVGDPPRALSRRALPGPGA